MTNYAMDAEEQDILDRFERGELRSTPDAAREMEEAREAARNTVEKTGQVNLRVTERDYQGQRKVVLKAGRQRESRGDARFDRAVG